MFTITRTFSNYNLIYVGYRIILSFAPINCNLRWIKKCVSGHSGYTHFEVENEREICIFIWNMRIILRKFEQMDFFFIIMTVFRIIRSTYTWISFSHISSLYIRHIHLSVYRMYQCICERISTWKIVWVCLHRLLSILRLSKCVSL